ncbi:MAG: iron-only hydrogenase system regulator [Lachnospiraceae bacterium]|nr:iron-only hydrogenase system regulator [Lachnospiraceae bacterium]
METRIAIIGIIIDDIDSTAEVNEVLHDYGMYVIGRMGIPYREKDLNIISIAVDAPTDIINQMAGKLGKLHGVSAKTMYSKMTGQNK